MKILVLLKPILDPAGMLVNRKAGKVFVNKKEFMLNPTDGRALEAALRIKTQTGGAEVIAAAVGQEPARDLLRDAKALGVNRALQITNASAATATLYAALANYIGVELIVTGDAALDTGENLGAQIASHLNFSYFGGALSCHVEGLTTRLVKDGQGYECSLPAVVTFARTAPTLRYAHGGEIITAYRDARAVETITLDELGLAAEPAATLSERGQSTPPEREFGKQFKIEEIAKSLK